METYNIFLTLLLLNAVARIIEKILDSIMSKKKRRTRRNRRTRK